jgi:hypothetical protein
MKKTLLIILFQCALLGRSYSIITLNQGNTAPAVGDMLSMYPADTMPVAGAGGANVTWTFNGVTITPPPSTETAVTVASTGYAATFPNANVAMDAGSGIYEFLSSSSTFLKQYGAVQGQTIVYNSPGLVFLNYPFTYNTTYANTNVTGTFTQGTLVANGTVTGDGYGTIIINGQTFSNVLRQKIDQTIDYTYTSVGDLIYHTVEYFWYDGVHKAPIMEIVINDATGLLTNHSKSVLIGSFVTGIDAAVSPVLNLDIYPNPARKNVQVDFTLQHSASAVISLYNSIGSKVIEKNEEQSAIFKESIDLNGMAKGIYFLEVIADDRKETRRLVVE